MISGLLGAGALGAGCTQNFGIFEKKGDHIYNTASVIDPEGSIATQFNGAADALKRLHERARKALASAKADPALHPDDGVVAAFEAAIDATAAYFNAIESLRDTFETLDALKSPLTGKTYTDADVLIADLLRG